MKINNKRELQNIAIDHSADIDIDIDYKDLVKTYRKCTKEPHSFLTIDTTLSASNHLRFRKNLLMLIKMILTDELLDDKTNANQAQYDLSREAAKISALSSKDFLEKY